MDPRHEFFQWYGIAVTMTGSHGCEIATKSYLWDVVDVVSNIVPDINSQKIALTRLKKDRDGVAEHGVE